MSGLAPTRQFAVTFVLALWTRRDTRHNTHVLLVRAPDAETALATARAHMPETFTEIVYAARVADITDLAIYEPPEDREIAARTVAEALAAGTPGWRKFTDRIVGHT